MDGLLLRFKACREVRLNVVSARGHFFLKGSANRIASSFDLFQRKVVTVLCSVFHVFRNVLLISFYRVCTHRDNFRNVRIRVGLAILRGISNIIPLRHFVNRRAFNFRRIYRGGFVGLNNQLRVKDVRERFHNVQSTNNDEVRHGLFNRRTRGIGVRRDARSRDLALVGNVERDHNVSSRVTIRRKVRVKGIVMRVHPGNFGGVFRVNVYVAMLRGHVRHIISVAFRVLHRCLRYERERLASVRQLIARLNVGTMGNVFSANLYKRRLISLGLSLKHGVRRILAERRRRERRRPCVCLLRVFRRVIFQLRCNARYCFGSLAMGMIHATFGLRNQRARCVHRVSARARITRARLKAGLFERLVTRIRDHRHRHILLLNGAINLLQAEEVNGVLMRDRITQVLPAIIRRALINVLFQIKAFRLNRANNIMRPNSTARTRRNVRERSLVVR